VEADTYCAYKNFGCITRKEELNVEMRVIQVEGMILEVLSRCGRLL
jgi:hypothetical protein